MVLLCWLRSMTITGTKDLPGRPGIVVPWGLFLLVPGKCGAPFGRETPRNIRNGRSAGLSGTEEVADVADVSSSRSKEIQGTEPAIRALACTPGRSAQLRPTTR